jgi:hypothetical protein
MSMMQELERIRYEIGEETYNAINEFLDCHKHYLITDVYYKESVWKEFNLWRATKVVEKLLSEETTIYYLRTVECQSALREIIKATQNNNCAIQNNHSSDAKISGIIFHHGEDDYGLWEGFNLASEDENAIQTILAKYDTDGCSVRGTRKEIIEEMM